MSNQQDASRLGKGLSAIFGDDVNSVLDDIQNANGETHREDTIEVEIEEIKPNPYQPRKTFDKEKLEELSQSIQIHGVFTPILIKKALKGYEIIAGERRFRASKLAGKTTIPANIVDFNDQQMMEIALLENIQREDLNVIEEAQGFEKLINKLDYRQEDLAKRIGKSREYVTNILRLLKLPRSVQSYVVSNELTMGHARALLSLHSEAEMEEVARYAISNQLSVRGMEAYVKGLQSAPRHGRGNEGKVQNSYPEVERLLQNKFQTKAKVSDSTIQLNYHGTKDLNRILEIIGVLEEND